MSEPDNIAKLLASAQPARMRDDARERIKASLLEKRRALTMRKKPVVITMQRNFLAAIAIAASLLLGLAFGHERSIVHKNDGAEPISVELDDGTTIILDRGAEIVDRGNRRVCETTHASASRPRCSRNGAR